MPNPENALVRLAEAITRINAHKWPREYLASVRELLDGLSGADRHLLRRTRTSTSCSTTSAARQAFVRGTLQDTANFTMADAGYKMNVIPQTASASLDCRFLPGHEDDLLATVRELAGEHVEVEVVHRDIALDAPFEGPLVEAMKAALLAEDPGAEVLPYCLSGRHRQQGAQHARHHRLRVRAAPAAGRPRLRADVPRHRRAGAGERAGVRDPGAAALRRHLLSRRRWSHPRRLSPWGAGRG